MWQDSKFLWLFFATILVSILEILSLSGIRLSTRIGIPFFLSLIILIGYQTLWHGLVALFTLNFKSIQGLMLIAIAGAWYLGKYEEAAVVIVLYTLAEKLEDIGIEKSQSALKALISQMPKIVFVKNKNQEFPVTEVNIGDVLPIKTGSMIPLDGKIVEGISFIDESTITGEPIPKEKFVDDFVFAGTINKQGYIEIEVTKQFNDTTFAKIKELTYQASYLKASSQSFIESFSQYYTPSIILLAFFWFIIPTLFFGYSIDLWLENALSLIVIACPCALVISTPISIYSAIGNASKHGALIKGGKYLEALGNLKAIALDKTRTLTYGRPIVSDIIPYGGNTKNHLLECAAGIEIFSEHPLAQSIVEAAKKEKLTLHPVKNYKSIVGKGAQADCLVCNEAHHCLGKLHFILEEHPIPQSIIEEVEELQEQGKIPVIIATQKEIEGVIALVDEIRPESKELIHDIKNFEIIPVLLTGDHFISAKRVAETLGIKEVYADLLPEDKAKFIQQFVQKYGTVAMVGDGINDAPALALSDVGISFGSLGSDAAIETASIVILNDRLDMIPFLIELGKKTLQTIRLNIFLAISVKFFFIVLALSGKGNLALAIFADVGITLIVILISLRLMSHPEFSKISR